MAKATTTARARAWAWVWAWAWATNVIQSQSGCRLLCILSRSTCMLPDASQDPTIRHILNDVASSHPSFPSARNYYTCALVPRPVALIEKFASHIKTKKRKKKMERKLKWRKFFGHLSFDDFRLASICLAFPCPFPRPCHVLYRSCTGPVLPALALVLSAAPSWLCRLCLCKKFVYCLWPGWSSFVISCA